MGIRVVISGSNDEIILENDRILDANFISDTVDESTARATEINVGLELIGKVTNEKDDMTKKLCLWSLVPSELEDAYRKLSLEVILAGTVVRKINLPNAFIVDYKESFSVKNGSGVFTLILKQKKEKISAITIEGGYNAS